MTNSKKYVNVRERCGCISQTRCCVINGLKSVVTKCYVPTALDLVFKNNPSCAVLIGKRARIELLNVSPKRQLIPR